MSLNEIYELVLLIGGVVMFVMSCILMFHPKGLFPNRVLGTLLLAYGFCVIVFAIQSRSFYMEFPHVLGVGTTVISLFFPLMYMYIKTYLFEKERKVSNLIIHCIPFVLTAISLTSFYIKSAAEKRAIIENGFPDWLTSVITSSTIATILLGVFYTVLAFRAIHFFENSHQDELSRVQKKAIKWMRQFLTINIILWAVGSSEILLEILGKDISIDLFKVYYLGLTLLSLAVGLLTLFYPDIFDLNLKQPGKADKPVSGKVLKFEGQMAELSVVASSTEIEKKEFKNEKELKIIISYIEETKPYLNSALTLQNLAEEIGISKNRVSELLNSSLGFSFYDVINEYRVKEVIRLINEGKHEQHTLLYLAEKSGFHSKTTFNRSFKKTTGKTPSQYVQDFDAA